MTAPILRPYQVDAEDRARAFAQAQLDPVLIVAPTGCHAPGQQVLLRSGRTKAVETLTVGDELMGPDSTPRQVCKVITGHGEMVRVTPVKGTPFIVNLDHVLTLVRTNDGWHKSGQIVDVTVREYLGWSGTHKHIHKLFRAPADFPTSYLSLFESTELPIDPYFLGLLLGDGSMRHSIGITTADKEIEAEIFRLAEPHGVQVRVESNGDRCPQYMLTTPYGNANPLLASIQHLGLHGHGAGSKFIPNEYKLGNRSARLALLAGLIDTDGSLSNGGFDYISKSCRLADDLAFVCRSLGLAAYVVPCLKTAQTGAEGIYYRVSVSGHCSGVPVRIPRKRARPRLQKKDPLRTGFSVEPVGPGEFFGFTLSGDGRYLLDDFTTTHNSGKTVSGCSIMQKAVQRGGRTLFLVDRLELIDQTSRKLDEADLDHGIIQADHWRLRTHLPIQVASVPTLHKRAFRPEATVVLADEAHKSLAPSYLSILQHYRSTGAVVIGLTATPYLIDGRGLGEFYRSLVVVAQTHELIEQGYLVPIEVYAPNDPALAGVSIKGYDFDAHELDAVMNKPAIVGDVVETWLQLSAGRTTAVFAVSKKHARALCDEFRSRGVASDYLDDETPITERRAVQERISSGTTTVICNVGILTLGWDMPRVSCVVLARPTLSRALYRQMVGRGTRPYPGKVDLRVLDHAGNVYRHGLPDSPEEFTLDGTRRRVKPKDRVPGLRTCRQPGCFAVSPATAKSCRRCGAAFPARERSLVFRAGKLESFGSSTEGSGRWVGTDDPNERARLLAKWWAMAEVKGNKRTQGNVIYKSTFGAWPDAQTERAARCISFPLFLVPGGRCRHCASQNVHTLPSPPHTAQVVCGACSRGLAWVPDEFAQLVAA